MQENAKRSLINISVLLPLHILQILLNFASRTVFVRTLGSEYLGINVIFGDISTLLSLTELGLNGAIMYSLYGPIKEKDTQKISAIINYAKGVFNKIALAIMIIGIILMPFLKYVINTNINFFLILWFYFLNLITVAVTYLATYKSTLISTDEKNYIVKSYYTIANGLKVLFQIAALFLFNNYTIYLIIGICTNLLYNFAITKKVDKLYPFLDKREKLPEQNKAEIKNNTKAVFKYKISTLVLNNTDNIIISTMLATATVGLYSGYATLNTTMVGLIGNFYSSLVHSIGKLNADKNFNKKEDLFKLINIFMFAIASICSICLYCLADDFIKLWLGNEFVMNKGILIAIILNFFVTIMAYPVQMYRETTKLFVRTQNVALLTSITNIVLSVILCLKMGLFGVLIATPISKIVTTFWFEPYLLFKENFKDMNGFIYYIKIFIIGISFTAFTAFIVNKILLNISANTFLTLIIKGTICLGFTSIVVIGILSLGSKRLRHLENKIITKLMKKKS